MSEGQTNPQAEVEQPEPQMNMFDVMFGSEESTNPEQASEPSQAQQEEVEEAPVEAQAEAEVEADVPEEVEEQYEVEEAEVAQETREVDPVYRVKVDGEEFEVSLDELRDGYQRQSDYTRKSQSLAEQRKAYEANLQAVQSEREQYGRVLENVSDMQDMEVARFDKVDWQSLKDSDPVEYMEKRLELQEAKEKSTQIKTEKERVLNQTRVEHQQRLADVMQHETAKLREALPEYADDNTGLKQKIRNYALELGFSNQDVSSITDHRVVLVLHKAMLQDEAKRGVVKKVSKKVPRVMKPGTPESKTQRNSRTLKGKRQRLQKSGHPRDAANVFLDMIS